MQKVHEDDKKALIDTLCQAKETDTQALIDEVKRVRASFDTAREMCEQKELCIKNLEHEKEKMQKVHEDDKKALIETMRQAQETDTQALIDEVERQKQQVNKLVELLAARVDEAGVSSHPSS